MTITCLIGTTICDVQSTNGGMTVVQTSHGEVRVPKSAKRVVVLDHSALETFQALDIPVAAVANSVPEHLAAYRSDRYAKLGTLTKPDMQAIRAFKPDLIISGGRQNDYYDSLMTIAPTVVFAIDNADFWTSFESNVLSIASWYGKEDAARIKLGVLQQKIEKVREKAKSDQNKALFVLHVNDRFNPNGPQSRFGFGHDMLGLQAAYNSPLATEEGRRTSSTENRESTGIVRSERPLQPSPDQINPDYLFIIDRASAVQGKTPELADLLTEEIKATKAFKNNKVFVLPGAIWYLAGSGLLSVDKKITDIGTMLYGINF